ncbi:unknown [Firmicutes bacterium CAG:552]|nr:unknown [Firmicutes bacterium CAG:552]
MIFLFAFIKIKQTLVFEVFVIFAFLGFYFGILGKEIRYKLLCQNISYAVGFDKAVIVIGMHAKSNVGRKSPRRGRPCQNISIVGRLYFKLCYGSRLFYVLVALSDFVRRKRRTATGAVRNDFVSLVYKSFFVYLFKRPPNRLDVIIVVSYVRMFHIYPVSYSVAHKLPLVLVFPYAFFALLDKGLDTVLFDVLLAVHTQLFFHFELDR